MAVEQENLVDQIRALARVQDSSVVREALEDMHEVDVAEALARLPIEDSLSILEKLDPESAALILTELPSETARQYFDELHDNLLAHYLDILPMDDAIFLREAIGEERFDALLNVIPREDAQEIRRLMAYPEDAVGRIMTEAFFEVGPDSTAGEILEDIRRSPVEKYEQVNDIYVLDEDRHLNGVFSLRKVIRARPDTTARELMNDEIITCKATDSAESAARMMARYGYYGLPVLDDRGRMVGLLTGDDAQAIIREADTEDVLMLGAVSGDAEPYLSLSPVQLFRRRILWLLALFVAETLTGAVLRHYTHETEGGTTKLAQLVVFIPLIIGAGGNSGSQTTTTITRALAVGEVRIRDALVVLRREFLTALMVGLTLGIVGYFRAQWWGTDPEVCYVIGIALPLIVIWSTTIGSMLPLTAKRVGIDPAVMSAPFISTFVDATGLIIYFELAVRLVQGLKI